MNNVLLTVTIMALEKMDNLTLAVANNALTGFGKLNKETLAYKPMKELGLIQDDGQPKDSETLLAGLSFEINRRVEAGIFI